MIVTFVTLKGDICNDFLNTIKKAPRSRHNSHCLYVEITINYYLYNRGCRPAVWLPIVEK